MNASPTRRSRRRTAGNRPAGSPPVGRRDGGLRPFFALAAAALLVKLAVLAQLGRHPLLQPLGELDTAFYVDLARRTAGGGLLGVPEPFFVAPLYVYFLAAVFTLGGSLDAVRFVQVVLGAAGAALVFVSGRQWYGTRAAWAAGGLAILTGLFSFYEVLVLPAALDPFLAAATLACLALALQSGHWRSWAAAGFFSGLLVLNRPNSLLYAAALGGWSLIEAWRARREPAATRQPARSLALPAVLILVLGLNAARNYAASGEWVLVSSHGGLNFYIGNGPHADGAYSRVPGITPSIAGQARDAKAVAEGATGRQLSSGEISDYFYDLGWRWMAAEPQAAARLWTRKVALLLNRVSVPLNFSHAYYRQESPILAWLAVGPWLLLPIGLAGLLFARARQPGARFPIWAAFVPLYGASVVAFFVSSRYRMPLLVPLCVTAGGALAWGWEQARTRRWRALVAPGVAAAILAVVVNWPLGIDDGRSFEETRWAVWLIEQGRIDEALAHTARIEAGHGQPGALHYRVGRALAAAGRFAEAEAQFRRSLEIDPGGLGTRLELGQVLVVTGKPADAAPHLRAAIEGGERVEVAAPWLIRALAASGARSQALTLIASWPEAFATARAETALDLGTMALELGAPGVAERWLRAAAGRLPDSAEAHEHLGASLLLQERVTDAIAWLERARLLDPRRPSARLNLAAAYARAGRGREARVEAEEALRLDPGESRAAALLRELGGR